MHIIKLCVTNTTANHWLNSMQTRLMVMNYMLATVSITHYLSIPLETLRSKSNATAFCISRLGSAVPDKRALYLALQYLVSTLWQLNLNWWKERLYEQIVSLRDVFFSSRFVSHDFNSHIELRKFIRLFVHAKVTKRVDSSSATLATREKKSAPKRLENI